MKKSKPVKDNVQLAQDILMNEVTEELHNEQIFQMWQRYKYVFIGAVVLVIASLAGLEAYTSWKTKVRLAESDTYEAAAVLNAKGQVQEALAEYETLKDGKTNYAYLALMRKAGILLEEGKKDEALAVLDELRQNQKAPEVIRAMATLGFVSQQFETADVSYLQSILNPYMTVGNPFYGMAAELSVLLLIKDGQNEKASKLLDETLSMTRVSSNVKERLNIIKKALAG